MFHKTVPSRPHNSILSHLSLKGGGDPWQAQSTETLGESAPMMSKAIYSCQNLWEMFKPSIPDSFMDQRLGMCRVFESS